MQNLWAVRSAPLDLLLGFRNDVASVWKCPLRNLAKRTDDIVKAVHVLRQRGLTVGYPMQTADGQIIFSVGKDTLTENQILDLLERGELHPEGVRKSVEASAHPLRKQAASR